MPKTESRVVPFRPPSRRRLHQDVAEQLRDAILNGDYDVGAKLPPERELAAKFQVNRTSVREAIKVLEGLGLVRVRQGDGATVQPLADASFSVLPAMVFHGGAVDYDLIEDLQDVMGPLLNELGRVAIERMTADGLAELKVLRDELADPDRTRDERGFALRSVIVVLSDIAGNRVWQMLARRVREFLGAPEFRAARAQLGRDPILFVPMIDGLLESLEAGRNEEAIRDLQHLLHIVGQAMRLDGRAQASAAARKDEGVE